MAVQNKHKKIRLLLYRVLFSCMFLLAAFQVFADTNIPSSSRSRKAIAKVTPGLKSALSQQNLNLGDPIFIRIFKFPAELEVWMKSETAFKLFRRYKICTYGAKGLGPKTKQGDGKAPEGFYFITPQRLNPVSSFHLSFNLGYPNRYDRVHKRTGSALMVHGSCVSIGCYAMTDNSIEEIYTLADAAFRNGQEFFRVHIFPFHLTDKNLNKHADSTWIDFWKNLKPGFEYFETRKIPPDVTVSKGRYVFGESL